LKIAALVAFAYFTCRAAEHTLISIDFDQQAIPVKTLAGSWEKKSFGHIGEGGFPYYHTSARPRRR